MDRHKHPYKCPNPSCKAKNFGSRGDLARHKQELHSEPRFYCPVASCKRHKEAFRRKDNMLTHTKNCHVFDHSSSVFPRIVAIDAGNKIGSDASIDSVESNLAMRKEETVQLSGEIATVMLKIRELKAQKARNEAQNETLNAQIALRVVFLESIYDIHV
jgi:hypothetical protein